MKEPSRRLIVNADDFGLSGAVDRGILAAHARGVVTSTSVIGTGEPDPETARLLRDASTLGVGVHLNISEGRPVLARDAVRTLVAEDGHFFKGQGLLSVLGRLDPRQLAAELKAQVERCREVFGREPDHLDCHQHMLGFHPRTLRVFLELARELRLPVRSPGCFVKASELEAFVGRIESENGIRLDLGDRRALAEQLAAVHRESGPVLAPDHFEYRFYGKQATWDNLSAMLEALREGTTELMCHPGEGDQTDPYGAFRPAELAILTAPALRERLRELGIRTIRYASL